MSRKTEIVAVGHLCMDKVFICEDYPQENMSKHILEYSQHPGGTACQAIVAAKRLGAEVAYMSPLGDDEVGRQLYDGCLREGVDMSMCRIDKGMTSHFTNVMVNEKRNTRTFLSYHGKFAPMEFGEKEKNFISQAKIVHLDNTRNENALAAADAARAAGVIVSLDGSTMNPNNDKNWELAEKVDILITSDVYPGRLTGIANKREALLEIGRRLEPRILISTNGEEGCIAYRNGELVDYPAYRVTPVDTTGAGDAFHGAFLFGLLRGYDFDYNIRFSSAVAAMSCLAVGGRNGLPRIDAVSAFMDSHEFG